MNKVSQYSYTLYIVHYPVLFFIFALCRPLVRDVRWLVGLECFLAIGTVLYVAAALARVFEHKDYFKKRLQALLK